MEPETTTLFVIMNGRAGGDDDLRQLVDRLRNEGYDIAARVTWEHGQAAMYAREAVEAGADIVVGCGGDGTLNEIVNAVMKFDDRPVVAGLPYGTANDFLVSLGIGPRMGVEELEEWLDVAPTPIDVGRTGEGYFLNMATAGIGAEVTAEASRQLKDVAGSFAYFVKGIPAAFDLPVRPARIEGPGLKWEGELAFLFVGNGRQSGGGWTLCPAAMLDDGLLDVVIVPDIPLTEMARYGRQMVKAEETGDFGPLVYRQVPEVAVEFGEKTPMNLDGEPVEGDVFEFSVVESAIEFLMPE